ncbi:diaminopimelate decarboxylase family protein [Planctomycetota bacterium]
MQDKLDNLDIIDCDFIGDLARQYGLPLHIYFVERMAANARGFKEVARRLYPNTLVAFSVKTNPCRGAIRAVAGMDLGVDVGSEYEFQAALEENIAPEKIICNGNAKSDYYLKMSMEKDALIAADSAEEIRLLNKMAGSAGLKARVLVRFTGMPLEGFTAPDQSTASNWTKFGFAAAQADEIFRSFENYPHVKFVGISAHIGTQICNPLAYHLLFNHFWELILLAKKLGLKTRYINIGGGYPVRFVSESEWKEFTRRLREQLSDQKGAHECITWNNLPMGYGHLKGKHPTESDPWVGKAYWSAFPQAAMLENLLNHADDEGITVREKMESIGSPTLIIEPGRSMIATAGVTVTKVMSTKMALGNNIVALDMGINNHGTNLITPDIFPAEVIPPRADDQPCEAFLVGRLCFSGDLINKAKVKLNRLPVRDELMVIHHTGAYSADHFASHSCGFPRPAKVAVRSDGTIEIWRRVETYHDVFS